MNKKLLSFVDHNYEDLELWYPKLRIEEQGWVVDVAGFEKNVLYSGKHGYPCISDIAIKDAKSDDYDGLLIPGGFAPDKLRRDKDVLRLTQEFHNAKKMIAMICHGGWIAISAKILSGRKVTSTIGIKDDMENAGAIWLNEALVLDGNLISSRVPKDLPVFAKAMVDYLKA